MGPDPASIHGIPDAQLPLEPSLSNVYPSIVIDPTGDRSPGRMADLASSGFQGLKTTLLLVERASGVLAPLKAAVGAY